jgi:Protein of unknown function (DUF2933)
MNISTLLPLLIVLACPLMMIFMMRGMHGGHDTGDQRGTDRSANDRQRAEARIADLEHEVAALRGASGPVRLNKPANKS